MIQQFIRMIEQQKSIMYLAAATERESLQILKSLTVFPRKKLKERAIKPTINLKVEDEITTIWDFVCLNSQQCETFLQWRYKHKETHSTGSKFLETFFILIFVRSKIMNVIVSEMPKKCQEVLAQVRQGQQPHLKDNRSFSQIHPNSNQSKKQSNGQQSNQPFEYLNSSSLQRQFNQILDQSSSNETTQQNKSSSQSWSSYPETLQAAIQDLIKKNPSLIQTIVQIFWLLQRYQQIEYLLGSQQNEKFISRKKTNIQQTARRIFFYVMPQLSNNIFQPEVYFYIVKNWKSYQDIKEFVKHLKEIAWKFSNQQENGPSSIGLNQINQLPPLSFIIIGNYYLQHRNMAQKALFYFNLGLKIYPQDLNLQYFIALGLKDSGQIKKAAIILKRLLTQLQRHKRSDRFVQMIALAQIEAKLQNTEIALKNLQDAAQLLEKQCQKENQEISETTVSYKSSIPYQSFKQETDFGKAMAFFHAQKYTEAYKILKDSQSNKTSAPKNKCSRKRQLYLAITAFYTSNYDDSFNYLEKALDEQHFYQIDPLEYLQFLKKIQNSSLPTTQTKNRVRLLIEVSQNHLLQKASELFIFVRSLINKNFKNEAQPILNYIHAKLRPFINIGQAFGSMLQKSKISVSELEEFYAYLVEQTKIYQSQEEVCEKMRLHLSRITILQRT